MYLSAPLTFLLAASALAFPKPGQGSPKGLQFGARQENRLGDLLKKRQYPGFEGTQLNGPGYAGQQAGSDGGAIDFGATARSDDEVSKRQFPGFEGTQLNGAKYVAHPYSGVGFQQFSSASSVSLSTLAGVASILALVI